MKKIMLPVFFIGTLILTGCDIVSDMESAPPDLGQKIDRPEESSEALMAQVDASIGQEDTINDLGNKLPKEKEKIKRSQELVGANSQHFQATNATVSGSNIEKIDELWNQYINYDFGFRIKYPEKNGDRDVEIIEDGNVIFISDGMYAAEIQQKKSDSSFIKASGIPFAILIQDVKNDDELESFIQKRYGGNCLLGGKDEKGQDNTFDVLIDTSNWNPEDPEGCFVNYITVIKYNSDRKKVASWDIGQDINFMIHNKAVDDEISDSFEFL